MTMPTTAFSTARTLPDGPHAPTRPPSRPGVGQPLLVVEAVAGQRGADAELVALGVAERLPVDAMLLVRADEGRAGLDEPLGLRVDDVGIGGVEVEVHAVLGRLRLRDLD